MNAYAGFLVYLSAILGFVALTLALNRVLGPKPVPDGAKLEAFECGATPIGQNSGRAVAIKYYGIAVVFILFDLETVFLYLWALGAQPMNAAALLIVGVFLTLLALITAFIWKSGLLEEVAR